VIAYENLALVNGPFFEELEASFSDTLHGGHFILGEKVTRFENEFAAYVGATHCIGVASGFDALLLSLKALDLPAGAEVLVPSNTYIATILAVVQAGLTPVLVEPDLATYNIDPALMEEKIGPRTKAVLVVHLYGKCCDMGPITAIARSRGLKIVEDCAQAHGTTRDGRKAGAFGDLGAFSFYPTKNLGALGDGGAITTSDDVLAERIRKLRNYGSAIRYTNDLLGYNSRLDEVQAGFLSVKLKRLDEINGHKRGLARIYLEGLKDAFIKPLPGDAGHIFHIFNVRHPRRNDLKAFLLEKGVATDIHYPTPPHRQKAVAHLFGDGAYPISEEIHTTTLSLPISFFHSKDDIGHVVEIMNGFPG
jgi:dTDP-4-amino-4,6-dideoxygalactose transaminase